jgi:hypothetical protein
LAGFEGGLVAEFHSATNRALRELRLDGIEALRAVGALIPQRSSKLRSVAGVHALGCHARSGRWPHDLVRTNSPACVSRFHCHASVSIWASGPFNSLVKFIGQIPSKLQSLGSWAVIYQFEEAGSDFAHLVDPDLLTLCTALIIFDQDRFGGGFAHHFTRRSLPIGLSNTDVSFCRQVEQVWHHPCLPRPLAIHEI